MKDKNQIYIITIVLVILLFLASIIALTFAYIGRVTVAEGNTNVVTSISGIRLLYSGDNAVSLNIVEENLTVGSAANDYSEYISGTFNGTVTLDAASNFTNGSTCQYKINYQPTTEYFPSTAAVNNNLKELELILSNGVSQVASLNLANVSEKTTLYTTNISASAGNTTATQNWTFILKFYNLNVDQSDAMSQRPQGYIEIEAVACGGIQ